ncbi:MAG: 3'-5' exoribonuclease YhaM family protein [Desulfovibrio sp.]|uniref:3'-5' exoribonuclease YhaM family protein n=1 Tax=Desulfovibrio sp. 7SRBS1 TaxID=3378064 RepID=UPI003B3C4B70
MQQATTNIQDIQDGQTIDGLYAVADARQAESRNGPYWNLTLRDATGSVGAKIWSPLSLSVPPLLGGMIVSVNAKAGTYRDQLQLTVNSLDVFDGDPDPAMLSKLVPISDPPPDELLEQLEDLLREHLQHKPWKTLCFKVLGDEEIRAKLLAAPGAKAIHHAYVGGLLEHTLAVTRVSLELAKLYPDLDRDVLLTAAAFHDLGKAWELTGGLEQDFTDQGRLLGHIQIGLEVLTPFLNKSKSLGPELALHLKHCILAHHGELAFGSPKRPKTSEALILHFADMIDSKLKTYNESFADDAEQGDWSPYVRSMERFLFKPQKTPGNDTERKQTKGPSQCLLPLKG